MKIYVDKVPKNCNGCIFKQNMSRHWELKDYCFLNKKSTDKIIMDKDCPLAELEVHSAIKRQSSNYQ